MTKQMHCGNCLVFRPGPNKKAGLCFLQPPTPVLVGMQQDQLGRPQPVTTSIRPTVQAEEFCAMWQGQVAATGPAPELQMAPVVPEPAAPAVPVINLAEPRHPGSDTFNGRLVPRSVPAEPTGREHLHQPVKVMGEWRCVECGCTGTALELTTCPGKPKVPDAETSA